jgi:hypothetical protein
MARAFVVSAAFEGRESGVEVWIEYQAANRRIRTVNWIIPSGIVVHARVWDEGSLVVDRTAVGPVTDQADVSGNYQMVDIGGGVMDLPPNITYSINVGTA